MISKELNKNGYFVCDNLVDIELINSIAEYWKQRFLILNHNKPNIKMVCGNLHLGEKDFDSYTNNHKWNLFRIFEFYWNQPKSTEDKITKEIARILRDREPTRKFEKTFKQNELEVLYTHLEKAGHSKEKIYNHLASFKGVTPDSMKRDIMRRRKKVTKK